MKNYIFHPIKGYIYEEDVFFISNLISSFQQPVFTEYGVYYGKSFINCILNSKLFTHAIAIDPFPNLHDARNHFFQNCKHYDLKYQHFENDEIDPSVHFNVVHIDSAHTEIDVYKDANSALLKLSKDGVIVFDDVWSDIFCGVTSGVFKIIHEKNLTPFLVTTAKIYICRAEHHVKYTDLISALLTSHGIDFFFEFCSGDYTQSNDINNHKVISLKQIVEGKLINNARQIKEIFGNL
ncbi:class I SAM-dependent methyltransferase [Opitutales bacterium]|nr:class I SAM-dependent methyltransferase [Opitutales bacterium]